MELSTTVEMIPTKLPLSNSRRQRLRDDRLWIRERQRALELNIQKLHCRCTKCWGRRLLYVRNVREHLIRNGRDPNSRMWRGSGVRDSSDEEWEEEFWNPSPEVANEVGAIVDTRGMIAQVLRPRESPSVTPERVQEEVQTAFAVADSVEEQFEDVDPPDFADVSEDSSRLPTSSTPPNEGTKDATFGAKAMEEAMQPLYDGAKSTKLATTILLMNLCTVHEVSNQCAHELFSLLHRHVLSEKNNLPRTYHAAKSLTAKLSLTYNSIHACEKGCMLFRGEHANALRCLKCEGRRYKDEARQCFPLKVLRHFPIIPHLQRMFRSPAISKLMVWHDENRSNRKGGDGLVRQPCDSKAWQYFHENVDPSFATDARNAHFALAADGVNPYK